MRLFVAIDLPIELRQRLSLLAGGLPGARWAGLENLHLTLRFIGETTRHEAEEIDHALAGVQARGFALRLQGLGLNTRNGRPTALWIGAMRDPALLHLQGKIETALQRCGRAPEPRRFSPHVTLARLDPDLPPDRLGAYIQSHNLFVAEAAAIAQFALFRSHRSKEQAVYSNEIVYALG